MHIAQTETGGRADRIVNQRRAIRDAGHAQAGLVQLGSGPVIMRLQNGTGIGTHVNWHVECGGHAIGGNVIMRRANPARGEHLIMPSAQRPHRRNDRIPVIRHNAHFGQIDPDFGQLARQMIHVGIAGAPGQNLIADHQHGGSGVWHGILLISG